MNIHEAYPLVLVVLTPLYAIYKIKVFIDLYSRLQMIDKFYLPVQYIISALPKQSFGIIVNSLGILAIDIQEIL